MVNLPVTNIIHCYNHTGFNRKAHINNDMIINYPGKVIFPKTLRNIDPGIYKFEFAKYPGKYYLLNIYSRVKSNQCIIINDIKDVYYDTGKIKYQMHLYEWDENETDDIIENTINSNIDLISCLGWTFAASDGGEHSLENPIELQFMEYLKLSTADDKSNSNTYIIDFKHKLRSINGNYDQFIFDDEHNRSYIIYKTGHIRLSGIEDVELVETCCNDETSMFFIRNNRIKSLNASKDDIICTHFKSYEYSVLYDKEFKEPGIAISNDDWRGPGFYIRMPNKYVKTVNDFRLLLSKWFVTNGIEILFTLDSPRQNNVLLDNLNIKTYYPNTHISYDSPFEISYFYKTRLS